MMLKCAIPAIAALLMLATPAMANECSEQLAAVSQQLADQKDMDQERREQVEGLIEEATDANKDGDEETCMSAVEDARALLERQ